MKKIFEIVLKRLKKYPLFFCLGAIGTFAFAPFYIIPTLWIGFAVLMYFLNHATKKKEVFSYAFSYGAGLGMASLSWISNALMVDGGSFQIFIPFALLGLGLFFGVFFCVPALLSFYFKNEVSRWLAFSSLFVFFEWIRSWLFTGFPWNLIGNIWTGFLPVLQFASMIGVYGLSLVTVLFFTSFGLIHKKRYAIFMTVLLCLMALGGGMHLYRVEKESVWGVKLRLVQPNIAQSLKWDPLKAKENFETLLRLSRENNDEITHVIWPESALPFYPDIDVEERMRLMSAVRQGGTLLTGGLRVVDLKERKLANSLFMFDDYANIVSYYDKSHLVPFGEYVPFRDVLKIDKVVPIPSDFVKGKGVTTMGVIKAPRMSPLVCYEVIFPGHVVDKSKRPEWILNITNDAWYGISHGPHQHFSIAQMRAVEEGMPLVRVANNGISAVINPFGEVVASLPLGAQGVVDSILPRREKPTIYGTYGNKVPLLFILIVFILAFLKRSDKK